MSCDIATLLERNLHGVFGEGDDALRRQVAEEIFHEDAIFVEQHGVHQGREEIIRIAGVIRQTHPTFRYTPIAPAEELHGRAGRLRWTAGEPDGAPVYAGTDFIVAKDGRIAAIYLFFDGQPDPTAKSGDA